MATHRVVELINADLPALMALSLESHGVPVAARFWVRSLESGAWNVVLVSPLVDRIGTRETYARVFDALEKESFATRQFVNSSILLLGTRESAEALESVAKGASSLPNLGPYDEVEVYPVADPAAIKKQGFLHFLPAGGGFVVSFAAIAGGGPVKTLSVPEEGLSGFLQRIAASDSQKAEILDSLEHKRSTSILTAIDLKTLYELGLI